MIVVSDTSPLSYLHQIGRLELLRQLYGTVLIPPAVDHELRAAPTLHTTFDWSVVQVRHPREADRVAELLGELDRGESEAIVLALESQADLLLIDEATGRTVASRLGVRRIGLLGVLLEAKSKDLIPSAGIELAKLQERTTFRLASSVREAFLRLAGESA